MKASQKWILTTTLCVLFWTFVCAGHGHQDLDQKRHGKLSVVAEHHRQEKDLLQERRTLADDDGEDDDGVDDDGMYDESCQESDDDDPGDWEEEEEDYTGFTERQALQASPTGTTNMVEVPCRAGSDDRVFTSYVAVKFIGNERGLDSCISETPYLEAGFSNVYTEMAAATCDQYSRGIQAVDLTINRRRRLRHQSRRVQQAVNTSSVPDASSFFAVQGNCRGCPVTNSGSFALFDDAFRRALVETSPILLGNSREKSQEHRLLGKEHSHQSHESHESHESHQILGICTMPAECVAYNSYGEPSIINPAAPSIDAFRGEFNIYIADLVQQGLVQSISGVESLQEYQYGPAGALVRVR